MKKHLSASCLLLALAASAHATMAVRNFQSQLHERFYSGNDKAFIGDPYDFSGVGSGGGQWATLISDCFFISATHFHPAISSSVTFWETNSLSDPSHTYTVAGGQQIGNTDLWVGWFAAAVDASIARYPVLDLPSAANYYTFPQFNYGVASRVGRNVSDDFGLLTVGPSTGLVFVSDYDNSDTPSVGGDETFLHTGDSGAPSFGVANGGLALMGIHWATSDDFPGTDEGEIFVDSAVPAYIDEIDGVLDDKGQSLALVPEPSSAMLIFGSCAGWLGARRRRNPAA